VSNVERRHLQNVDVTKVADAMAGTAIAGFAISWAHAGEIVTVVAGAVAIIAGLAAAWFHIERALQIRRDRRSKK
jgi:hypothetical protein